MSHLTAGRVMQQCMMSNNNFPLKAATDAHGKGHYRAPWVTGMWWVGCCHMWRSKDGLGRWER